MSAVRSPRALPPGSFDRAERERADHELGNARAILVATDGGAPSAPQIKRLGKALAGGNVRVAVVTDKIRVRFIVSTIALLNSKIKTFARSELYAAYGHLDLTATEIRLTQQMLLQLEVLIDPELRWS
jgi:hypothetical protein